MPQGPSVLFDLTAEENLAVVLSLANKPGDPSQLLGEVGLGARHHVKARHLSGGERRRLEIARALSLSPVVLLCDEPFAGLGPRDLDAVRAVLSRRVADGLALVITDHRVKEALAVCHDALLLVDGQVDVFCASEHFLDAAPVNDRYLSDASAEKSRNVL